MKYSRGYRLTMALVAATMIFPVLGNGQARRDMAAGEVGSLPQKSVAIDNSEASGLSIRSASSSEITRTQFEHLTNAKASVSTYVSVPRTTLVNNTGRAIAGFSIALLNSVSGHMEVFQKSLIQLQPGDEFAVEPLTWASVREGAANRKYAVQSDGKEGPAPVSSGWDSKGAWIPGALGELSIFVAQIQFADGTSWTMNR
jgi:hypothetical protein